MTTQNQIFVVKHDGSREPLDIDKIHVVVANACDGINGVSPSEVEIASQLQFFDGIKTTQIQETLIKAASDLITEDKPNYQYVAGRLVNYAIRKQVFGQFEPPSLYDHVRKTAELGYYTKELLDWYTKEEFDKMDSFIDHDKDMQLTYIAMEQFRGKYLVQNRTTKQLYETPQFCYILIAATLFHNYPIEKRLKYVKEYYDVISNHIVSLATPVMAGVRTPQKQFSSCTVISAGDSLDSITSASTAIVKYVSQKAGIGINVGRIRAKGSPVRNGDTAHTGIIPFIKLFYAATKSCSQGAIRDGSATAHFPIWHLEIEDLIVLKNNRGTEESRCRHLDYSVQISKLFYERLIKSEDITLFCPNDVPGLYEAFFADQDKFKELYERAERNTRIRKKKVKARDLFSDIMKERKDTGRIYIQNVDNVNDHGAYDPKYAPIIQSNLCVSGETVVHVKSSMGNFEREISMFEVEPYLQAFDDLEVLSYNTKTAKDEYKKVLGVAVTSLDAEVIEIEDEETGTRLTCTPEHKILTARGYIAAKDLVEDDVLINL